ncbi:MAG: mobile mystery protein B [Bacteroidetes bacterium]|nr:mobile mystery protein B [Bacteroidota bacterium]
MGLDFTYIEGQSPLDEEEKEGLKIKSISTRGELDEFEQHNIEKAIEWTIKHKFTIDEFLTEQFVKELHKQMFNQVWTWAGQFRKSNKNLGVDKLHIGIELRQLLDDCKFWIKENTFSEDEIAIRFKHRMVKIHPFPHGNGRHSRLIADIMTERIFGKKLFSWGNKNLT